MAEKVIHTEVGTKPAHLAVIAWFNRMLENYVSSFYDSAIKNILSVAFIKEHTFFLLELYQGDGKVLSNFMTVIPTDTENYILMVHDAGDGSPTLYNDTEVGTLFEFNEYGLLSKFYENVTIDLKNKSGVVVAECYLIFEDLFGIKCPMVYIKNPGGGALIGKGLIDLTYSDKYSGTYAVKNKPLEDYPKYIVTNVSKSDVTVDVPILSKLNMRYTIQSKRSVRIPVTEWTTEFFGRAKEQGALIAIKE